MANPSRDWRHQERSRESRRGTFNRDANPDHHDEDQRRYRSNERDDYGRDDADYGRSSEGIGDYGGYDTDARGAYGEEERSYHSRFSPTRGRRYGHPDRDRDEERDSRQERYGTGGSDRSGFESHSGNDRERSSFAYGREEDRPGSSRGSGSGYGRHDEDQGYGGWDPDRYPHQPRQAYGNSAGRSAGGSDWNRGHESGRGGYEGQRRWQGSGEGNEERDDSSSGRSGGYGGSQRGPSYRGESSRGETQRGPSQRGKGPKGYQRSDERLKEVICERLSEDPDIDASEITLTVSGGLVKLTGTVESRAEKYEVEEMIAQCNGVKDVENQLRVQSRLETGRDLALSSNAGYGAAGLEGGGQSKRPEATSSTSGLSSPSKKQ